MHPLKNALLFLLACFALTATAQQDASREDLQRLESAINSLQRELGQHRGKYNDLQSRLKKNEVAIGKLSARIHRNVQTQSRLGEELTQLRARQRELSALRDKQQVLIGAQMRSAYQLGNEKTLKVLLNQEDPAQVSRALTYVDYFNRARLQAIDQFNNTLTELRELRPGIESKTSALKHSEQSMAAEKLKLSTQQHARQQTLASLNQTIQSKDAQLQQHNKDRARLEALLNTVEDVAKTFATIDDAQPFASRKGKMKWPAAGRIVNRFGGRRQQGGLRWQGVEIRANSGNSVKAIHHGRVVFADWLGGQGLLIVIDHGDGYMSLYGHNQSLLRQTGDWIRTGEAIATVGDSGGRNQPGLYFEIRQKGVARNPAGWCRS